MATHGIKEFEVADIVGVFVLIMLNNEDADRGRRRFQWDAEPGGRRRTDEFNFAKGGQAVKIRLRDEHGAAGAENISRATAPYFLRRGSGIVFVREKGELKRIVIGIVEGHKAVFGGDDALQSLVDAGKELIEVGGLV